MPDKTARITFPDGKTVDLPVVVGTEGEMAIDIETLRAKTGWISLDEGYRNTGSVRSEITFIDPDAGILRHRGYAIEDLCANCTFVEVAQLLFFGELPTKARMENFSELLTEHEMIHEGVRQMFDGFPPTAHPMAVLSAMLNTVSCFRPQVMQVDDEKSFENTAAMLMSKVRTLAAAAYKTSIGHPIMYPDPRHSYCANFLHMMHSIPRMRHEPGSVAVDALNKLLILHADHEQNCSTSTVRLVGSSGANLFACCAAGVCALWGPLHGGANVAVMEQLEMLHNSGVSIDDYMEQVKQKKKLLFGFGHPVYKNFDPRAKILKASADQLLSKLNVNDPLLNIARKLEEVALADDYFVSRKLYPNVDFYSGIIMRALGIPTNMFTVMFAIGRMPGWIAQWWEVKQNKERIYRPRQIYAGKPLRKWVPLSERK